MQRDAASILLREIHCTVLVSAMPIGSHRAGKAGAVKLPPLKRLYFQRKGMPDALKNLLDNRSDLCYNELVKGP